ncbi:MAG: phosphoenolpyruvate--protein phosphotransferase, partial [Planctomycetales bacterium]|nr:phosphoenolpyruvate--protein phosphotransferase [Planctomycetales bacterium]
MELRRGIAVSPGVAIGPALVLGSEGFRIPRRLVRDDAVDTEIARFRGVLTEVCAEISANVTLASERMGAQYAAIFSAHLQMAQDPKLAREVEELIRQHSYSPEFASSKVLRKYAKTLQSLGDRYMAERAVDLYDLEKRILRHLLGERREELAQLTEPVLVLAHNLTPSETANLDTKFVLGFATEAGGKSSHTAILAGALEIPAVVAVGDFLSDVSGGETIIIDGNYGVVIVAPDEETIAQYRDKAMRFHSANVKRESLGPLRSETKD